MSKKTKIIVLLCTFLVSLTLFAGCKIGVGGVDDILKENNLTAHVSYYSNGGCFNGNTDIVTRDIYYQTGSPAYEITSTSQKVTVAREKCVYDGWYYIKTVDKDGVIYFECDIPAGQDISVYSYKNGEQTVVCVEKEGGKYLISKENYSKLPSASLPTLALGERYDFTLKLAEGDDVFVAAKWAFDQVVEYYLLLEGAENMTVTLKDGSKATYKNLDKVGESQFESSGKVNKPAYELPPVKADDATFAEYYVYDEDYLTNGLEKEFTSPITRPDDGSNVKVFVKYVAGKWKMIRVARDVKAMFADENANYYLVNDIDCTGANLGTVYCLDSYSGTIRGNGCTVKGFKLKTKQLKQGEQTSAAMFGELKSGAKIENITFTDVTIDYQVTNGNITAYMIAYAGDAGAFENACFKNFTVNINLPVEYFFKNMPEVGGELNTDSWLFGGSKVDKEVYLSNDDFTSNSLVTVESCTLSITWKSDIQVTYPTSN